LPRSRSRVNAVCVRGDGRDGRVSKGEIEPNRHRIGSGRLATDGKKWTIIETGVLKTDLRDVVGSVPEIRKRLGPPETDDRYAPENGNLNHPDGTRPCKHLEKNEKKTFRALRVDLQ
jgi:hypothetical protein